MDEHGLEIEDFIKILENLPKTPKLEDMKKRRFIPRSKGQPNKIF